MPFKDPQRRREYMKEYDKRRRARIALMTEEEKEHYRQRWQRYNAKRPHVDTDPTVPEKMCCRCKQLLPSTAFHRCRSRADGLQSACKECYKPTRRNTYQRDPERAKAYSREWKRQNIERVRALHLRNFLKRHYNMTLEAYNALLKHQDGLCAICGKPGTRNDGVGPGPLEVDHCHVLGTVRGLLRRKCNSLLGLADDNIHTLQAAIKYLS